MHRVWLLGGCFVALCAAVGAFYLRTARNAPREAPTLDASVAGAVLASEEVVQLAHVSARSSYYLSHLSQRGIETRDACCTVVTPRRDETPNPPNPNLIVVPGTDGYAVGVRPYLRAMGSLELPTKNADPLAAEVSSALQSQWVRLAGVAEGALAGQPLRVMVQHYARPGLPGQCVTVSATFYDVADPYLDAEGFNAGRGRRLAGSLLTVRKTYQLTPNKRLIAAAIELRTGVEAGEPNVPSSYFLDERQLGRVGADAGETGHFEELGGGVRYGLLWVDRAAGEGTPDSFSCAYTVGKNTRTATLTPELLRALFAFTGNA